MIQRDYLTPAEAAEYCGMAPEQFKAEAPAELRPFTFMGVLLYRRCDIEWHMTDAVPVEYHSIVINGHRKARKADLERARRKRCPGPFVAKRAARRAAEAQRTPAWADVEKIRAIYAEAARIARATGVAMHVDHIVPLRGQDVCGLHVEYNLQVLPATDNLGKGNRCI